MITLFFKLLIGHFVADYPLQGDFLSKAKNHRQPIPGVPWRQALVAHAAMHGGMVWYLTGSPLLGATEFVCHALIDYLKCDGRLTFNADQYLHFICKAVWVLVAYSVL